MARQNALRSIKGESNLASRIRIEREGRGWSYEALAKRLTDIGCSINGSAIYRIEKGEPPRRIAVDELIALAQVFGASVEDLLTPIEVIRKTQAKAVLKELDKSSTALVEAVADLMDGYCAYFDLGAYDPELREYVDNYRFQTADEMVPDPLRSVLRAEIDGTPVEIDDSRLRAAMIELHHALIEAAGELAEHAVETNNRRSEKEGP